MAERAETSAFQSLSHCQVVIEQENFFRGEALPGFFPLSCMCPLPSGAPHLAVDEADGGDEEVAREILTDFFHGASRPNMDVVSTETSKAESAQRVGRVAKMVCQLRRKKSALKAHKIFFFNNFL